MSYSIDRYSGTTIAVVEDGTINNTLDIKLIGKNYAGYGEAQNENFVHLLENFSSATPPPRPISGQLWYDSGTKRLKFFDGVNFKDTSRTDVDDQEPVGVNAGDFWYDTVRKQLFVFDGDRYRLVGPQDLDGYNGSTSMVSMVLVDTSNYAHPVVVSVQNGIPDAIFSAEAFTIDDVAPVSNESFYVDVFDTLPGGIQNYFISRFPQVYKGMTLRRDDVAFLTGVSAPDLSTTNPIMWGTASDAQRLNGIPWSDFVRRSASSRFSAVARFDDPGFTVGNDPDNDLAVFIDGGTTPTIKNQAGTTIVFQTTSNGTKTPLTLVGANILPGTTETSDIGSSTVKYKDVYASRFFGAAQTADTLKVGVNYRTASDVATPNTIAARDASGNLTATNFLGLASNSTQLGGQPLSAFVLYADPDFHSNAATKPVKFSSNAAGGFIFGTALAPAFEVQMASGNLEFRAGATGSPSQRTPLIIQSNGDVVPKTNNLTKIGSSALKYAAVYATSFEGTATALLVDNTNSRSATTTNTADTVVARDANRVIRASTFDGAATALYVDGLSATATISIADFSVAARDNNGDIWANKFQGIATKADTVKYGNDYVTAVTAATANTVAVRDASGDLTANVFNGTATSARYADLAEKYLADLEYEVGTVISVGGPKEVTASVLGDRAIGVVSGSPAYMMNSELVGGTYIALKGRVPVKVEGDIKKGDRLIAANAGVAMALRNAENSIAANPANVFAIALGDSNGVGVQLVEAIIL